MLLFVFEYSNVKVFSKYWSDYWANYTPCLLSVFSSALASSYLFHSCSLNSHLHAFLPVPRTVIPSILWNISDVLEKLPQTFLT